MDTATALDFAQGARTLGRIARARKLVVPGFRSPPRLRGVDRSMRRAGDRVVVAVRVRGRPWVAVAADMIEGVIVANRLSGPEALRLRGQLWAALGFEVSRAEPDEVRRVA